MHVTSVSSDEHTARFDLGGMRVRLGVERIGRSGLDFRAIDTFRP